MVIALEASRLRMMARSSGVSTATRVIVLERTKSTFSVLHTIGARIRPLLIHSNTNAHVIPSSDDHSNFAIRISLASPHDYRSGL